MSQTTQPETPIAAESTYLHQRLHTDVGTAPVSFQGVLAREHAQRLGVRRFWSSVARLSHATQPSASFLATVPVMLKRVPEVVGLADRLGFSSPAGKISSVSLGGSGRPSRAPNRNAMHVPQAESARAEPTAGKAWRSAVPTYQSRAAPRRPRRQVGGPLRPSRACWTVGRPSWVPLQAPQSFAPTVRAPRSPPSRHEGWPRPRP